MTDRDAKFIVKDISLGKTIVCSWVDGGPSLSPRGYDELFALEEKAHAQYPPEDYPDGTVVGEIWLNDAEDAVGDVEWREKSPSDDSGECPLPDTGASTPLDVSYCPACGGTVEATDTPTMFRCAESGDVFYVER